MSSSLHGNKLKKMFTNIDKARVSRFTVLQGRAAGWVEC